MDLINPVRVQNSTIKGIFPAYKLFLFEKNKIKNLYWALEGTRTIKFDEWIYGERRWSRDGGDSAKYLTGIHVLFKEEHIKEYLNNFRTDLDRRMLKVFVKDIIPKPTNDKVWLADSIYIPSQPLKNLNYAI